METGRPRTLPTTGVVLVELGAALVCTLFFWSLTQKAWVPDGRHLMSAYHRDLWLVHNVAYLPVARALGVLSWPFGVRSPEGVLGLLSACCGGFAFWALLRSGRVLGLSAIDRLLSALLVMTTPAALFWSTAVEIHALQLAASALAVLLVAESIRKGKVGRTLALPSLMFFLVVSSHMTGLLWAPALAFLYWPGAKWRSNPAWDHALAFLLLVGLAFWLWAAREHTSAGVEIAGFALRSVVDGVRFGSLWHELIRPLGGAGLVALAAIIVAIRRGTRIPRAVLAALILVGCAAPFAAGLGIDSRGGYYLSLHPVLGLIGAFALLSSSAGGWRWCIAAAIAVQVGVGWKDVRRWEVSYAGHEWTTTLFETCGDSGVAITASNEEWRAVTSHSLWVGLCPQLGDALMDLEDPEVQRLALDVVLRRARRGEPVVVTRTFWELNDGPVNTFRELLAERLGPPRAVEGAVFLVFDPLVEEERRGSSANERKLPTGSRTESDL